MCVCVCVCVCVHIHCSMCERVCCLLVLNSVTSTLQWIRQPKRDDVYPIVCVCSRAVRVYLRADSDSLEHGSGC